MKERKIPSYTYCLMLCLIGVFGVHHNSLYAQQKHDPSFWRFGILAGYNMANMNFNKGFPEPASPIAATWKGGIVVGLWVDVPIFERLVVQPGYAYTQRRGGDKSSGTNYLINYISFPVLLKYPIGPTISVVAGPQTELLISARQNRNKITSSITHDVEERSIGVTAGLDIQVYSSFLLSARYLQGLNRIGIGQRSNVKEFKFQVVHVTAGFTF